MQSFDKENNQAPGLSQLKESALPEAGSIQSQVDRPTPFAIVTSINPSIKRLPLPQLEWPDLNRLRKNYPQNAHLSPF